MRRSAFFNVDASLMQQLGASLITDDLQALIELIKNAYDADATTVRIVIDAPDRIVIDDNGHGMDESVIERGWLTLSNSLKVEQKRLGILTSKQQRTPLGDKGLGRLSAQRLGNRLRIETTPEKSDRSFAVEIDWTAFTSGIELGKVPVTFEEFTSNNRPPGTKLTISDLVDPTHWVSLKSEDLRVSMASSVSPYAEVANFRVQAFLNGVEVSPSLLIANLRKAAWQHLQFIFDGKRLVSKGSIKAQALRGMGGKAREDYERYFQADNGQGFLKYLLLDRKSTSYSVQASEFPTHFIDFTVPRDFSDIIGDHDLGNPGEFHGEVDAFSLDSQGSADVMQGTDAFNSISEAKQLVKDLSGIRVYRDGFVIKTAHDWLKLGSGWTSAGSFYGLKPTNTMGYVAISGIHNSMLHETTDRQSFIEDSYYLGFFEILQSFVKIYNDVAEHLRRSWLAYAKQQDSLRNELPSRDPKVIEGRLNESFDRVSNAREILNEAASAISETINDQAQSLFPGDTKLTGQMSDVKEMLRQASQTLHIATSRSGLTGVLVAEFDALQARLGEVYELVSLGITAEALSHDISVILERLSVETNMIQKHAKLSNLEDLKVLRFFEIVRSTVSALEKQLGHLDPALKYTREKRDVFPASLLVSECASYYRERLGKNSINFEIVVDSDFKVSMNKGKLIQVLDNLILNSEYWVKLSPRRNEKPGIVIISVKNPLIVVEDSGRGVEPSYEETLFDPFITAKPKGEGRGLGLFIATQLLELDGCSLRLLPERNADGRRFRMAIGLEGVALDA
jgi:signal transduction histidine kinase